MLDSISYCRDRGFYAKKVNFFCFILSLCLFFGRGTGHVAASQDAFGLSQMIQLMAVAFISGQFTEKNVAALRCGRYKTAVGQRVLWQQARKSFLALSLAISKVRGSGA